MSRFGREKKAGSGWTRAGSSDKLSDTGQAGV